MATRKPSTTTRATKTSTSKEVTANDIALAELTLANKIATIPDEFKGIKETIDQIKNNYSQQVAEAKAVQEIELNKLEQEYETKKEDLEQEYVGKAEELENNFLLQKQELDDLKIEIEDKQKSNEKELEELAYQHSITIRDADLTTLRAMADKLERVVIKDEYYQLLQNAKYLSDDERKDYEDRVDEAKKDLSQERGKYTSLKNSSSQYEAVTAVKIESLEQQVAKLELENKRLNELQEKVPAQIAQAVKEAKVSVNVSNDSRK